MTRRPLWKGLGVAAGVLSLLFVFEVTGGGDEPPPLADAATGESAPPPVSQPAPKDLPGWTETILRRPLFDPARQGDPSAPAGQPVDSLPRLAGVMQADGERRAIFQPEGERKPVVVGEGDLLGGWKVRRIADGAVTIDGAGGTRTLRPKFSSKPTPSQSGQGGR
ncbi:hypothetical protein [Telmatospirillum siberiense]|uniref:Type II secretion system protein GspC N-terminal domain-containing protein n=1 Tax=Telmatospirillum siberiense TaxID=382514 RepID=A0A2N3PQB5_9PROT|nr:hypothetical protein [Telmatospirillum siberiense]PKU22590.1 hypothetical protein CWS72_20575 [Telmatospirillum siberiense]